jgi:type I restriction enzyme M protein
MIWITPSEKDTDNAVPASLDYDAFGRIYEYFLGEFAMSEGQGGGEPSGASLTTGTVARRVSASDSANQFYTPGSIVRLLTEVIDPYHGRILETLRLANSRCVIRGMKRVKARRVRGKWWPCASTSAGMFASSARFVSEHKRQAAAGQSALGNRPKDYSGDPTRELSIHGVEKTDETGRLCRLVAVRKDLAVHGLEGEIKHGGGENFDLRSANGE